LSEAVGHTLPWNSLSELRAAMYKVAPPLQHLDRLMQANPADLDQLAKAGGALSHEPFRSPIEDFYLTIPIARASRIMGECSALRAALRLEAAESIMAEMLLTVGFIALQSVALLVSLLIITAFLLYAERK